MLESTDLILKLYWLSLKRKEEEDVEEERVS